MKPFEELATAAIDGVATPEERAALSSLIERDPAATCRERLPVEGEELTRRVLTREDR